jgi:deoxyribonuclease V
VVELNIEKLKEEQLRLAKKVITKDEFSSYETIAGADQLSLDNNTIISAIVVLDAKTLEVVEKKYAVLESRFPYIPGFLSYRESPAIVEAYNKLRTKPDILVIKGNGILHPRRMGLASHVGLLLNKPTIGIAKTMLCGTMRDGTVYMDKDVLGKQVRLKETSNPLFVSPGHMISLKTSVEIVKKCAREPYKVPLPLALAHKYANKIKKKAKEGEKSVSPDGEALRG